MSSVAFCAICFEDARPICEDLQSISACGHVFHELCLQQWMEYCPSGRKPTCPLCKQSCTAHDVHRLYFQSAGSESSQPQVSPSKTLQTDVEDPPQVNDAAALRKLENQLTAAKTALQSRNEQLKELDFQVSASLHRAEKAEAASAVARREVSRRGQIVARADELVMWMSLQRKKLQEEHETMASVEDALWDWISRNLGEDRENFEELVQELEELAEMRNVVLTSLREELRLLRRRGRDICKGEGN